MRANAAKTPVSAGASVFQPVLVVKSVNVITTLETLSVKVVVKVASAEPRALVKKVNAPVKNVSWPLLST